MAGLPRIMTVDPTGEVTRVVSAALSLVDRPIIHLDIPDTTAALDEVSRGGYQLVVSAFALDSRMKGWELAMRVKQTQPDTAVLILADENDPEEFDAETRAASPYVYLRRPVDVHQFLRVLLAGLEGRDILSVSTETASASAMPDLGPVPSLDARAAEARIDGLLVDVGAMAIVLCSRAGDVLVERGAVGYLDREQLTQALLPSINSTMNMGRLVGKRVSSLQVYDGDIYDVFVLSVGVHHFLCLVFDGQAGTRQFGAVNRFGRRVAEDLIQLIGEGAAYNVARPVDEEAGRRRAAPKPAETVEETIEPIAVRAEEWLEPAAPAAPDPEPLRLEPIANIDLSIFDAQQLQQLESMSVDDLFDPDKLAEIASETRRERGPLTYEEAKELGIIP